MYSILYLDTVRHIILLLMDISYSVPYGGLSIPQRVSLSFLGGGRLFRKSHASLRDLLMFGALGMVLGIWGRCDRPQLDGASS